MSSFLIKLYGIYFASKVCPYWKIEKFDFSTLKNVQELTRQPPTSWLKKSHIVMSLWRQVKEDNSNNHGTDLH